MASENDRPPVLGHEHKVGVQRYSVGRRDSFGLSQVGLTVGGYADALPVPHRTDTGPAADVGADVRMLVDGGVEHDDLDLLIGFQRRDDRVELWNGVPARRC